MSAEEGGGHVQEEACGGAGAVPDPVHQALLDELRSRLRRGDLASIRAFAPMTTPPGHGAQQGATAQEGGGAAAGAATLEGASIGSGASAAAAASTGGAAGGLFSVEQIHAAAAIASASDHAAMSDIEPSSFAAAPAAAAAAAAASSTSPAAASVSRASSESSASPSPSPASPSSSSSSSSEKSKAELLTQVLNSVPFVHLAQRYSRENVLRPWLDELPTALLLDVAFHVGVYGDYELTALVGSRGRPVKTKNRSCLSMMDSAGKYHSMRSSDVASRELLRAIGFPIGEAPTQTLLSKMRDSLEAQVGRFLLPATMLLDIVLRIKPAQRSSESQKRAFASVALLQQCLMTAKLSAEGDLYQLFERAMDNHLVIDLQPLADAFLADGVHVPPVGANWTLQRFFTELLWTNMLMRYNDMLTLERWMAKAGVPQEHLPFLTHNAEAEQFEQQQQQQLVVAAAAAAAAAGTVLFAQTVSRPQPALIGDEIAGPGPATRPLAARALPNCIPLPALLSYQAARAAAAAVSVPANGYDLMDASEAPNVGSIGSAASPDFVGPAASPDFAVLNDDLTADDEEDEDMAVRRTFDSSSSSNSTSDSELLERQAARAQSFFKHQL